jgi:hypothetical protein
VLNVIDTTAATVTHPCVMQALSLQAQKVRESYAQGRTASSEFADQESNQYACCTRIRLSRRSIRVTGNGRRWDEGRSRNQSVGC